MHIAATTDLGFNDVSFSRIDSSSRRTTKGPVVAVPQSSYGESDKTKNQPEPPLNRAPHFREEEKKSMIERVDGRDIRFERYDFESSHRSEDENMGWCLV